MRLLASVLAIPMAIVPVCGQSTGETSSKPHAPTTATGKTAKPSAKSDSKSKAAAKAGSRKAKGKTGRAARTARIKQAFVASTELRPMAQQLATLRTPAAYAGVTKYAHQHSGDAAAAAYLALGHAYLLDRKFADAEANLRLANQAGDALADYTDFLGAQASHQSGNEAGAEALLHDFASRHPDSIFNAQAPVLEANVLLAMGNAPGAQQALTQAAGSAGRADYQLAQG